MTDREKHLRQSAILMRTLGWGLAVGLILMAFVYPPGFLWGAHPEGFPRRRPQNQRRLLRFCEARPVPGGRYR